MQGTIQDNHDVRGSTIVILWPNDSQGVLKDHLPEMIQNLKEDGANVVQIGDGKTYLTLEDVEAQLSQVKDPSLLFIHAHGGNFMGHRLGGFESGGGDGFLQETFNNVSNTLDVSSLFQRIPPNYHTVISGSCYGGSGNDEAAKHLPEGTYYFPMTSAKYENLIAPDFYVDLSKFALDGKLPVESPDFWFSMMQMQRQPREIKEDTTPETIKIIRNNFPTRFAIGGRGVFDLEKAIRTIDYSKISDAEIIDFVEKYDKLVQFDLSKNWEDPTLYSPDNYTQDQIIQHLRDAFDTVQENTLKTPMGVLGDLANSLKEEIPWDHPGYVLAHAFAFEHMLQTGQLNPTLDNTQAMSMSIHNHNTSVNLSGG